MDKFEEIKFVHERTQKYSERRQISSQIYLTINTVIFGILAFMIKDSGLHGWNLVFVSLPFIGIGSLACIIWHRIIWNLEAIIGWHYQQLREMEDSLSGSHRIFNREWDEFFKPRGKKKFSFSNLEAQLPRLLIALYIIYAFSLVIAAFLTLI